MPRAPSSTVIGPAPPGSPRLRQGPANAARTPVAQGLIGAPQLAFVRAWAEGIDPTAAWQRFMASAGAADARRARSDLRQLREQLGMLARSHGRPDIAALLRRDPEAMAGPRQAVPTLDEFRARQPPDFYSEDELVALYEAEHGGVDARSAARRRQRLRERLVLALQWLGRQVLREPMPGDAVASWLDERVAARLAAVGIRQLQDLQQWIATHGAHWHRPVPRLGAIGAQRIVDWLGRHASTLGALPASAHWPLHAIARPAPGGRDAGPQRGAGSPAQALAGERLARPGPHAAPATAGQGVPAAARPPAAPVDPAAAAVRTTWPVAGGPLPIERFEPPPALAGAQGRQRTPAAGCRIAARDDRQAVLAWLAQRPAGSHTWRSYRKEAERLLLWAVLCRGRALSSLDAADLLAYRRFLRAPDPAWLAPRSTPRWSPAWRPFEGPLSPASADTAIGVLRALMAWLTEQRYLDDNPWAAGTGMLSLAQAGTERAAPHEVHAGVHAEGQGRAPTAAGRAVAGAPASAPAPADEPDVPAPAAHLPHLPPAFDPTPISPPDMTPPLPTLTAGLHTLLRTWLAGRPGLAGARLRAVLHLLIGTGLRVSEIAAARLGWLAQGAADARADADASAGADRAAGQGHEANPVPAGTSPGGAWVLHVHGPGRAGHVHGARTVALPFDAALALGVYLSWRELPADLTALDPQAPLIARLGPNAALPAAPLSAARLGALLAQALSACADDLAPSAPDAAGALRRLGAVALRRAAPAGISPAGYPAA